ncbi:MAG: hypothetical protein LBM19_00415 [Holosporales bacterium]|jgi:hypothetical protein|nr:hypothetical protein [Holosporales bacterium]
MLKLSCIDWRVKENFNTMEIGDVFIKLIEQLNSSVFVLLVILVATFFLAWKISSFITAWRMKRDIHNERIGKVEKMTETVIELKTKVDLIYQNTNPNGFARSRSPMSLTEKGQEIKELINAESIFNRIYSKLKDYIKDENLKNAYDIQTISLETAKEHFLNLLTKEELIKIKDVAFKQGLILEDFYIIFGILLRNKILKEKNIAISEIDMRAPSKTL